MNRFHDNCDFYSRYKITFAILKHMIVNFIASCYTRYSSFPIRLKNVSFAFIIPISFAWGALWQSASRTSTKIPETLDRVTRANLSRHIPRPLLGSPLARLPFVRFNSSVRLFDFASLGRKCPGDFSCRVYPPSSVCSTYFSSHGDTTFRFGLPLLSSALFAGYNILENMCHNDETWRRWIFIAAV